MKKSHILMLALAAILMLGLVGPTGAQGPKAVMIAFPQELDSLNPMYTVMYFAGITRDLYLAPAWTFDNDLNPVPVLVKEVPSVENGGVSEDGQVLTLTLRDDIVWSDGVPITSADFVFTYEMIISDSNTPQTRYPYDEAVASVTAPDERTVVVTFTQPLASWLGLIFTWVLPEHVLRPVFEADFTLDEAAWNRAPTVGSGPYVFDEWETGNYIRFERNENYYGPQPKLDAVAITFIPDSAAYVIALENEAADVGTFVAYSDVPRLEATGVLDMSIVPSGYNEAWHFNVRPETGHPALQDVNVRRALAMAFDRWQITEDLLLGLTYPASGFWEGMPYDNPDIEPIPYDPELAKQLLDEAGWVDTDGDGIRDKDGVALKLRYVTNTRQIRVDTGVVAQQMLREVGVDLVLETHPSDIYFGSYAGGGPIATGQFDIAQWSASPAAFPDPDTARFLCRQIPTDDSPDGNNWNGYCDPVLDELFAEQSRTMDYDARVSVFHQIDERMAEGVFWVGVWHDPDLWIVNKRVEGEKLNGITPFWNIVEWDIAG